MNTMSTRDRWLAAALPAMISLLIGWMVLLRPAGREVAQLRQRVENQGTLEARRMLLASERADRAEMEEAIEDRRRNPVGEESVFDRNRAMQLVSMLCAAHGLSLDKSSPEPGAPLAPSLKDAVPALVGAGMPPQVWRIELTGNYAGVVKLLEGLQKSTVLIVPLNLSMQTGKTERQPAAWVLTLWL
jgi:hypothetical protein